jgi:hypothetical protein
LDLLGLAFVVIETIGVLAGFSDVKTKAENNLSNFVILSGLDTLLESTGVSIIEIQYRAYRINDFDSRTCLLEEENT